MSLRAIATGIGVIALSAGTANAGILIGSETVDFEGFAAGTVITNQISGMTISAVNNNGPDTAMIFDSGNWTGGDADLQTPGYHPTNTDALGNILIISEDNDSNDPDDDADGGQLIFDLDFTATALTGIIVDIESSETWQVDLYFQGGLVGTSGSQAGLGDNSFNPFALQTAAAPFDEVRISLSGSGAVGELTFIPTPGSFALLAGAGLLGTRRRR